MFAWNTQPFPMGSDWCVPVGGRLIHCESYEEAWALCDSDSGEN